MGLLIINADDWGAHAATTDAILRCFAAGAVTSASAMVFMEDSVRAARLAGREALSVGLHLNLTQPFADPATSPAVRERQLRLTARFRRTRLMRCLYDPSIRAAVDRCVADQLDGFRALYEEGPTHLDGHQQVHVCPNVLLSRAARGVKRARTTHSWFGRSPLAAARAVRRAAIGRLFRTPDDLFALSAIHPALGGAGLERVLALARTRAVEIMVHPARPEELEVLLSPRWRRMLDDAPLGSFAALP